MKISALGDFHSGELSVEELKSILKEFVEDMGQELKDMVINDDGLVEITLSDDRKIEIEIDWNEIILR